MGAWGIGVFDNDAAADWFGSFERLGFLAVTTPLVQIGEYNGMKKPIPAETEQAFWAACEVISIASGCESEWPDPSRDTQIAQDAEKVLKIPNLRQRVTFTLDCLKRGGGELEDLWDGSGEGEHFRAMRDRIEKRTLEALT